MKEHIETLRRFFEGCPSIAAIVCEFAGSGDSGQIDDVMAVKYYDPEDGSVGARVEAAMINSDRVAAEEVALAALERQGVDWYNNDGGQGVVAITRDGQIHCRTEQNYVVCNTYNAKFLLGDDEIRDGGEAV